MIVRYQELFIGIAAEFYWYWYCILLVVRLILLMIVRCQELFIRHHQEYICQAFFWTKQRMVTSIDGNIYWVGQMGCILMQPGETVHPSTEKKITHLHRLQLAIF